MNMEKIGELAFLGVVIIAILAGLLNNSYSGMVPLVLVVLGIIVGLLNVSEKETTPFLVASIALLASSTIGFAAITWSGIGAVIDAIVGNIGTAVAPAAIIVALKAVHALASKK